MDLQEGMKIYFIGIGGIAMSAVAGIAKQLEFEVLGSDSKELYDPAKSILDNHRIEYYVGYSADQIKYSDADLFIASSGEDLNNPEIAYLVENNIPIHSFSEFLCTISQDKLRIVVTGTHGKSTTAGMLGRALQEIDDSSFMTGAVLLEDDVNFHQGDGHYYVFEGDEYKALYDDPTPKFHLYKPDITVLTNLEFDHPDIFSSLEELEAEFAELLSNMPSDGLLVYNADSAPLVKLAHQNNLGQVTFSLNNPANYVASNIKSLEQGSTFTVTNTSPKNENKVTTEQYSINLFGDYNVYNALAVIATLRTLGFSQEQVQSGLESYLGVKRRLEFLGKTTKNVRVFDDYAHHPTAVAETIKALKERFPDRKLWAIFEPHTFSRTEAVINELATCFTQADQVLIAEIYQAREKKTKLTITGQQLVDRVLEFNPKTRLVENKLTAKKILQKELNDEDVVVVMAVGSFNRLGYEILAEE